MTGGAVDPDPQDRRERIVAAARAWIGTPYQHQASVRGAGADCLGLVRGVWREVVGAEPCALPPYTRRWDECECEESLWRALCRHLSPAPAAGDGDVALFRMIEGAPAKHVGILASDRSGAATVIHAYSGRSVVETTLSESWRHRSVAAFAFPGRN